MLNRAAETEVSLSDAVERVVESSQRALVARMELLRIEAEEDLRRTLASAVVAFSGVLVLLVAWTGLMALLVYLLGHEFSFGGSLAALVALNAAAGLGLLAGGIRSMRRLRLMRPDRREGRP